MSITVYGFWRSIASFRVRVALRLKGLPFEETLGGFGGGGVETAIVMDAFGRGLVLEPFFATVILGGGLLRRAAPASGWTRASKRRRESRGPSTTQRPATRTRAITKQKTGNANSFASTPEVPETSAAPIVTKLPVTWAVNRPCKARNPAVSI